MPGRVPNYGDFGERRGYHPPACTRYACNERRKQQARDEAVAEIEKLLQGQQPPKPARPQPSPPKPPETDAEPGAGDSPQKEASAPEPQRPAMSSQPPAGRSPQPKPTPVRNLSPKPGSFTQSARGPQPPPTHQLPQPPAAPSRAGQSRSRNGGSSSRAALPRLTRKPSL